MNINGDNKVYLKIPKEKIASLIRIIEGYDNVGLVTTINPEEGLIAIQQTPDTEEIIANILNEITFVEKTEQNKEK
ncbi:MAG: DUF4911 domain-containing protein [Peptococcia bacterium]